MMNIGLLSYIPLAYDPYYAQGGGFGHLSMGYWLIIGISMVVSWLVSHTMESRMKQFSQVPVPVTGAQVAQQMLRDHGITDVKVVSVAGHLTDHYNPADKTVNLSDFVYASHSLAAVAVAAHECGHAVQHAKAYAWLTMRSKLVPMVSISSKLVQFVLMAGIILAAAGGSLWVLGIGVALFATTTLFAFITLPVEFDASRRALAWLERSSGLSQTVDLGGARSALFWAAMTYVVGALSSLAMLLYYLALLMGSRRSN